ncbi:hypothetical protein [Absicoccus intestinalis]|uniref:Uncharacterized protein n=1 Tax=Absicoccus intestinalis TaxID=2926319 RepID=A0ABU4WLB2_9FIRM|nr:hypothetical protein [Absicoccus sp. CLA-KB-P134]MDX8417317.1 hypothetical protein [Absicoccus sp. CLA-KB-P134]
MPNLNAFYGLLVLIFLIFVLRQIKKHKIWRLIQTEQYQRLEKELDKTSTRMLIKAYNRENLKLNCYLMQRNKDKINGQYHKMRDIHKKPLDDQEFLTKMFNYYLQDNNKNECKNIISAMEKHLTNKTIINESKMLFNIIFNKSSAYIDLFIDQMKNMKDEQKGIACYYLSIQYKNKGEVENQQKYEKLSKQYLC